MKHLRWVPFCALLSIAAVLLHAAKTDRWNILIGPAAWADSAKLIAGQSRRITPQDLPAPGPGVVSRQGNVLRQPGAMPKVPAGFDVNIYAETGNTNPRQVRTAPNGDHFVVNQMQGSITIYRGVNSSGQVERSGTFVTGLIQPFGIAFYPPGGDPQWVYAASTNSIVRFPYKSGDLTTLGPSQIVVQSLPAGGHDTRDIVFSNDGTKMFVAIGSASNIDDPDKSPAEFRRANILEYTPEGRFLSVYASGIRNPVGLAIHPTSGELWTSVNERDNLGDNLVPDFITHVQRGGFYGWPYFYMGGNPDPRLNGAHSELKTNTIVPDVLIQPHSASLGMTFYTGSQFPSAYLHDAFAAQHGSWNRSVKSGHGLIRVPLDNGKASGVYQDFLTGFIDTNGNAWGRPVGVTTASDGSLLVTDDLARIIWRIAYTGSGRDSGRTRTPR